VGAQEGGGGDRRPVPMLFPADAGTPSIDQHSRLWHTRNVAKRLGATGERDRGRAMADRPADDGPGNRRAAPPPSPLDAAGQSVNVAEGWASKTTGSGRISVAVAHLAKTRRAAQRGDAIVDRPRDAECRRPQAYCQAVTGLDSRKSRNSFPGIEKKDPDSRLSSCLSKMQIVCHKQSVCIPGKLLT